MRAESLNNRAVSLFELGDLKESLRCLYSALDLNDNLVQAISNLALIRWHPGKVGPANLIKSLEAANKRLDAQEVLSPLVEVIKNWARARKDGVKPHFPDFKLCLPPSSINVYRENQLLQSVRSTINSHLNNKRYAECSETLITSWKSQYFSKNRFYRGAYEELLKFGKKEEIAGLCRINTLSTGNSPVCSIAAPLESQILFYPRWKSYFMEPG